MKVYKIYSNIPDCKSWKESNKKNRLVYLDYSEENENNLTKTLTYGNEWSKIVNERFSNVKPITFENERDFLNQCKLIGVLELGKSLVKLNK